MGRSRAKRGLLRAQYIPVRNLTRQPLQVHWHDNYTPIEAPPHHAMLHQATLCLTALGSPCLAPFRIVALLAAALTAGTAIADGKLKAVAIFEQNGNKYALVRWMHTQRHCDSTSARTAAHTRASTLHRRTRTDEQMHAQTRSNTRAFLRMLEHAHTRMLRALLHSARPGARTFPCARGAVKNEGKRGCALTAVPMWQGGFA